MKTNVQISGVVTMQLICAFVFAYAKGRISHDAAQIMCTFVDDFRINTVSSQ